tara:strand:+ start:777 stop:923 length:147 start_codon:yes stop_codon:yes gene_type:complete
MADEKKKAARAYVALTGISWADDSRTEIGEEVPGDKFVKWLLTSGKVK